MSEPILGNKISTNLTEIAYDTIKDKIINGEFRQGDIVSISAMSKVLEISRTPITNACQKLEKERFLTIVPKQGVVINTVSISDAREIYEMRIALETYLARKSFEQFNNEDLAYLEESFERQKNAVRKNDVEGYMKEDMDFHRYILEKRKNSEVMNIIENVFERAYLLGIESCKNHTRLEQNIDEHEEIIHALKEKDCDKFVLGLEKNILNGLISLAGSVI